MKKNRIFLLIGLLGIITIAFGASDEEVAWKFETGGRIYPTPVLVDSILYIGSLDGYFYALDNRNGSEYWKYFSGEEIRTTAAFYDTIICFAGGNMIYGLNISGDSLWSFQMYEGAVVNSNDQWDYFNSSPKLIDSIVYIGTEHGKVYGINVKTGSEVFSYQTSADYTIETTPAVYDGKIYFGDWDGVFYCVDLDLETEVWSYDTKDDNTYAWMNSILTNPVVLNDSVYFAGKSCNLYCLNAQTGSKIWMHHSPTDQWLMGGPVIEDSIIYLGSSDQRLFQGFNKYTGETLWSTTVDHRVFGSSFIEGDLVFFGTGMEAENDFGSLFVMKKQDHSFLALFATGGQVHSSPVVIDSIVYFGCSDGYVYAVNHNILLSEKPSHTFLKDGASVDLGELTPHQPFNEEIWVYNDGEGADSVVVSCTNSNVYLDPENFILPANDSELVSISIDLSTLTPKWYGVNISFVSHNTILNTQFSKRYSFTVLPTGIEKTEIEEQRILVPNAPNPFVNSTNIPFRILKAGQTRLIIYNAQGEEIAILIDEKLSEGSYDVTFNGSGLPDGIYYYQLQSTSGNAIRNMVKIGD